MNLIILLIIVAIASSFFAKFIDQKTHINTFLKNKLKINNKKRYTIAIFIFTVIAVCFFTEINFTFTLGNIINFICLFAAVLICIIFDNMRKELK